MHRRWNEIRNRLRFAWNSHQQVANRLKLRWTSHYSRISGKPAPSGLDFTIYRTLSQVPLQVWNRCNGKQDIFLSTDYLSGLEQAPPANMQFRYVVFSSHNNPAAIAYFQILELGPQLHGSAILSLRRRNKSHLDALHNKLAGSFSNRILVCGNALVSGEHGYAMAGADESQVLHALAEAAYAIRETAPESIAVNLVKDFYASTSRPDTIFTEFGFYAFDAGPNLVVPIRKNWMTMADYLQQMKPKYRKQAENVIRKGAALRRQSLTWTEILSRKDELYRLYSQVADRAKFKLYFLSPEYFSELKRRLGDRFVCDAYFAGQELIGFTTRIFNGPEMEGYTHGLKYEQNKVYELYQNFMLDDIRAALAAKCSRINTGRTSAALKSSFGATANPMKCYLRFSGRVTNQLIQPLVYFIKPAEEYCRHPFEDESPASEQTSQ